MARGWRASQSRRPAISPVRSGWLEARAVEPTFKQLTFRRGIITEARFAPDGQTILYSAAWDGGPVQLYRDAIVGPESGTFGPLSAGLASVSSANELALLLGCRLEYGFCVGTLARMPLSGGAPRELLEDVVSADWTPDGVQLAAIHNADGEYRVEFPIGKRISAQIHRQVGLAQVLAGRRPRWRSWSSRCSTEEKGTLQVVDLEGRVSTLCQRLEDDPRAGMVPERRRNLVHRKPERQDMQSLRRVALGRGAADLSRARRHHAVRRGARRPAAPARATGRARAHDLVERRRGARRCRGSTGRPWPTCPADGKTVLFYEWGEGVGASPCRLYPPRRRVRRRPARRRQGAGAVAGRPMGARASSRRTVRNWSCIRPARARAACCPPKA